MVGFVTILFYLVNSKSETMRETTWEVLSQGISILCALLFYNLLKDLMSLATTPNDKPSDSFLDLGNQYQLRRSEGGGGPTSPADVGMAFLRMSVFYFLLEFMLLKLRHKKYWLSAVGLIGAHTVGFMTADAFGSLQEMKPFCDSLSLVKAVCVAAVVALMLLCSLAKFARHVIVHWDGKEDEGEHSWEHQCEHSENEFIAFALGLLITQTFRFVITGKVPGFHGAQQNDNWTQIHQLLGVALGCAFLCILADLLHRKIEKHGPMLARASHLVADILAMTMSWSLFFWGMWVFWKATDNKGFLGNGDHMTAQMMMALLFSAISFLIIFALEYLQRSMPNRGGTIKEIILAFVLLMGLAWESAFMTAIHTSIDQVYKTSHVARAVHRAQLCLGLYILLVPAWMLYILPQTVKEHGHEGGEHGGHGHAEAFEGETASEAESHAAEDNDEQMLEKMHGGH